MSEYKNIIFTVEGNIATVTFNRPDVLNRIDSEMLSELEDVVDRIYESSEIRAVVTTGVGKAFIAGADINSLRNFTMKQGRAFTMKGQYIFNDWLIIWTIEPVPDHFIVDCSWFCQGTVEVKSQ